MADKVSMEMARERVDKRSPPPKYDPTEAGFATAFIAGIAVFTCLALASIEPEEVSIPVLITVVIAFCVPYFYYRNLWNNHHRKVVEEFDYLVGRQDADG